MFRVWQEQADEPSVADGRAPAERQLEETNARLRQITETIDEVFWLTDPSKRKVIYISPGYERVWGRTCEELYADGSSWLAAVHPEDRARVEKAAYERQISGAYDEEYRVVRPDGTIRWVRDRAYPVRNSSGEVYRIAGVAKDVTDRRLLEAQLVQAQKLDSIGKLAGGIAHDFNNILTVIASNCALLAELGLAGEAGESLREIETATERASALTRQLLAFARQEVLELKNVDVAEVVADTERLLRRILGEDVLLEIDLGAAPSVVRIDPGSLVQVLMNVAVNARDAMPRGGKLRLTVSRSVVGAAGAPAPIGAGPGEYVTLTMTDDGVGIPSEILARVFEPFFTTKAIGHGTGLGLSVVHGIVTQAGGAVDVASRPGETTLRIHLPRVDAPATGPSPRANPQPVAGHETILVVDDEDPIRCVVARALRSSGYVVLEARDGPDALRRLAEHDGRVDLLLTDVVMPHMDGRTLADELSRARPDLRVLFTSGYTDDAILRYGVERARVAFLRKPFDLSTLRKRVRDALDLQPPTLASFAP